MTSYLLQQQVCIAAKQFSNNEAIRDGEKSITYGELESGSRAVAAKLKSTGHRKREVVGVVVPKSLDAVVAFLGILRAGGAYVPLDPTHVPTERINRILQLGEITCVVASKHAWSKLLEQSNELERARLSDTRVVLVGDGLLEGPDSSTSVDSDMDDGITDDDIAYILYTSGSTGAPKGVTITHRNALTFIRWAIDYFHPRPGTVFACHAPLQFDLSVFDLYVALSTGGCVALVPHELAGNPKSLLEWMSRNEIEYWYSVPSVWVAILNYARLDKARLESLKQILFAGEVFPPKHLARLMTQIPWASYYNLYGPTETNVCTAYRVTYEDCAVHGVIPIGTVCANTEAVVLDDQGCLVGPGGTGELLVKGSIVTKGYYQDEERTKAAFIQSPLRYHDGALLYKTGDIVKVRADGNYEYVGRADFMVKIAGFRVELQEVERAMQECVGVSEAIAVAYADEVRGTKSLGALIMMEDDRPAKTLQIRTAMAAQLPTYMIPEVIISANSLPRTSNGKIDRDRARKLLLQTLKGE